MCIGHRVYSIPLAAFDTRNKLGGGGLEGSQGRRRHLQAQIMSVHAKNTRPSQALPKTLMWHTSLGAFASPVGASISGSKRPAGTGAAAAGEDAPFCAGDAEPASLHSRARLPAVNCHNMARMRHLVNHIRRPGGGRWRGGAESTRSLYLHEALCCERRLQSCRTWAEHRLRTCHQQPSAPPSPAGSWGSTSLSQGMLVSVHVS